MEKRGFQDFVISFMPEDSKLPAQQYPQPPLQSLSSKAICLHKIGATIK